MSVVRLFASGTTLPSPASQNDTDDPSGEDDAASNDAVTVSVDSGFFGDSDDGPVEEKVTLRIPTATFATLAPSKVENDEPILVVSPIGNASSLALLASAGAEAPKPPKEGQRPVAGDAGTVESNVPLVAMKIELRYLASGETIDVEHLNEPIIFTMPTVKYVAGMSCLFYDASLDRWSDEGTGVAEENKEGETLTCWTLHFTIFGAFLQGFADVFLCAQFQLFTAAAMKKILMARWCWKPGAVVLWVSLGLLLATFAISVFIDHRRSRSMAWCAEFFMIPRHPVPEDREMPLPPDSPQAARSSLTSPDALHEPEEPRCWQAALTGPLFAACAPVWGPMLQKCGACHSTAALWDAVDDVASEWFESFGELRSFVQGLVNGLEMGGGASRSSGRLFLACHGLMCTLTLLTSRRLAASRLGLTDDVVAFVLQDRELARCLVDHHRTTDLRTARGVRWYVLQERENAWVGLHDEVCSQLQLAITRHKSWKHFPLSMANLFFMHSPFGSMWSYSIFMTCKMRAFFFAIEVIGAFLLCALFFQGSGVTSEENEGDEECEGGDGDVAYALGRIIAVGIGSALVSGLPVKALNSLHHRRIKHFDYEGCPEWTKQLRAWAFQDRLVWLFGSCYLAFGTGFVILFLANISEDDHEDFSRSEVVAVVQTCLILPLALAFSVPALATLFIFVTGKMGRQPHSSLLVDVHHRFHRSTNAMLPMMQV